MSNGTVFPYTEQQQAVLFAQFSKTMELAREGQRDPRIVSRALQSIISDENITVGPKVTATPDGKVFHVVGNFNSAAEALEAGNYPVKWGYADGQMQKVPMVIQPVDAKVRIVVPGRVVYNHELPQLLPNLVDPLTALAFGARFPDEQLEKPLATVWRDALGKFWYVYLNRNDDGRGVDVDQNDPGGGWSGRVGFLVRE